MELSLRRRDLRILERLHAQERGTAERGGEVDQLLDNLAGKAILVGGQALALWAKHFRVELPPPLVASVTSDADFLGSAQVARELASSMLAEGWELHVATFDDGPTQTAKLSKRIAGEGIKQVDFLAMLTGLRTDGIRRRAVQVRLPSGTNLSVLHPLDVLESRLKNIQVHAAKRDKHGIAQADLALRITRAYLESLIATSDTRSLFKAIERVVRLAQDKSLTGVYYEYKLEPLDAIPADQVLSEEFRTRRWPQIQNQVAAERSKYAARMQRTSSKPRSS